MKYENWNYKCIFSFKIIFLLMYVFIIRNSINAAYIFLCVDNFRCYFSSSMVTQIFLAFHMQETRLFAGYLLTIWLYRCSFQLHLLHRLAVFSLPSYSEDIFVSFKTWKRQQSAAGENRLNIILYTVYY